jgi:Flp pilus assembly protein TadG
MGHVPARLRTVGREDRGSQVVEFALILPVLLLIVLGIINFGYLFGQKLALNQAVREGARMAVVPTSGNPAPPDTDTEVASFVRAATGGLLVASNVVVTVQKEAATPTPAAQGCATTGVGVGDQLRVSASYAARPLVTYLFPIPGTFTLTSSAVFRCEW